MGYVLLAWLTLAALAAAIAITLRLELAGRAERYVATAVVWNALIVVPIFVLGFAHRLYPSRLAVMSAIVSHGALAIALPRDWRKGLRDVLAAAIEQFFLPFDAVGVVVRARSLVVLPLVLCAFLVLWTAFGSYFTPSWRQWDSLWYHETIVGFTLQEHAIKFLDLPGDLQKVNGYPRLCEMTNLWFVVFTDRRLIEVVPSFVAPPLMVGVYAMCRRYGASAIGAMGFACATMLMPTAAYLLESTYVDLQVALFVVAATYFVTRPVFRPQDAALAAVCLALATASKFLVLPNVGILCVIALVRLFWQNGLGARPALVALGSVGLVGLAGFIVYGRNWLEYHNPMWPDLDGDHFGHHFVGSPPPGLDLTDMNLPPKDLFDALVTVPYSVRSLGPKGQLYDFGFAVTWVVLPLGFLASLAVMVACVRTWIGRIFRVDRWVSDDAENALMVLAPTVAGIYLSPALWGARYHIAHVGLLAAMIAWVGGRARWTRFAEDASVVASVASIAVFFWTTPRWWYLPSEMKKLMTIPYPEREVTPAADISIDLGKASGSAITKEVGLKRETTIGPGAIVAFDDQEQFPALYWNNDFSNRIVYVPGGSGFTSRVHATGAIWFYCRYGDPYCEELKQNGWKDVGPLNVEGFGAIIRRAEW